MKKRIKLAALAMGLLCLAACNATSQITATASPTARPTGIPSTPTAYPYPEPVMRATARPISTLAPDLNVNNVCVPLYRICAGLDPEETEILDALVLNTELTAIEALRDKAKVFDESYHLLGSTVQGTWSFLSDGLAIDHDTHHIVGVSFSCGGLTLGNLVEIYGPPTILYLTLLCEGGDFDCSTPPFDGADFVWPDKGMWATGFSYDNLHIDTQGNLMPFEPDFRTEFVVCTFPFSLDEYENSDLFAAVEKSEWPGFVVASD